MQSQQGKADTSRKGSLKVSIRRLLAGALVTCAGVLAVLVCAGAFLTYRILTAHDGTENVTPASYLLSSYQNVNFTDSKGEEHLGWLLMGLRGAPVIILCHGYDSNRSALLSLGTVLQANHFNVYLFNFDSEQSKAQFANLGPREASVLMAAVARINKLPGVDAHHVGLFGRSVGAYAALAVSEREPDVDAVAVDSVYGEPAQMFDAQMNRLVGGTEPFFGLVSRAEFYLFTLGTSVPQIREAFSRLAGKPKLFLASDDDPILERSTRKLYLDAPAPKRLAVLPHTETDSVSGQERKEYEDQILNFFLRNLPLRSD